jgi:hypothetical protein
VTDATERTLQVRILASSADSGSNFDLRCHVREGMLKFVQQHYPDSLPRMRAELREKTPAAGPQPDPAAP